MCLAHSSGPGMELPSASAVPEVRREDVDGGSPPALESQLHEAIDGVSYEVKATVQMDEAMLSANNFMAASVPGCHVAYHNAAWIVALEAYRASDLGLSEDEEPPDLSLDPEDALLSVINTHRTLDKAFYITMYHPAIDGLEQEMAFGIGAHVCLRAYQRGIAALVLGAGRIAPRHHPSRQRERVCVCVGTCRELLGLPPSTYHLDLCLFSQSLCSPTSICRPPLSSLSFPCEGLAFGLSRNQCLHPPDQATDPVRA